MSKLVEVHIEDIEFFFESEKEDYFVEQILHNSKRYLNLFYEAADKVMPKTTARVREDDMETIDEIITHQRLQNVQSNGEGKHQAEEKNLPPELLRK